MNRILIVCEPCKDGVFDYARDLISHLHRQHPDITVDLAYSSKRSSAALEPLVKEIESRGGKTADMRTGNAPQPADLRACREILRLVREGRPQVIHAHSSKAGGLCRALRLLWPGFPPVVYTPNAYFGLSGKKSPATFLFNFVERLLGPIGMTINCSSDEREFALHTLRVPPRHLTLIENGVDMVRFHPASPGEKAAARKEFGLPENVPVIISIGRQSFQKNYEPLYAALDRILSDSALPCFFAHAGAGSEALGKTLSPQARQRFKSFEFISAIERFMNAADAFILTSRYEGLSLSVLSGVACGLKLFLTRVLGNRCLQPLGFDEVSWIEPTEDATLLASRIEEALRAWLAQPVPVSSRQVTRADECLNQQTQFEKVYRLYEHLADQTPSP
ncbi:MAG TPA: glycosyltransferase [Candidatus Methylacidiphilales bacterium]